MPDTTAKDTAAELNRQAEVQRELDAFAEKTRKDQAKAREATDQRRKAAKRGG